MERDGYARDMSFFDHLSPVDRERLTSEAEIVQLVEGETLVKRGSSADFLFQVGSGRLEEVDGRKNPEVIVDVLIPGRTVGEIFVLEKAPWDLDVRAVEPSTVLVWPHDALERLVEGDAALGVRFFRALGQSALERDRLGRKAIGATREQGAPSLTLQLAAAAEEEARRLAGQSRAVWAAAEEYAGEPSDPSLQLEAAERAVMELADSMNAWLSNISSTVVAQRAGNVLRTELRPFLAKAQSGQLGLESRVSPGSRSRLLAHLLLNIPSGTDALGERIDAGLLGLPSVVGLRARTATAVEVVASSMPKDRSLRGALLQPNCGALLARLLPLLTAQGADLAVIDGDPSVLSFVDAGLQARPAEVRLSMHNADLSGLRPIAIGSELDIVIMDGLVDYLPSRQLGVVLSAVRSSLRDGGRVVMTAMGPSSDARLLEHVLRWPMLRRTPGEWTSMLKAAGFDSIVAPNSSQKDHCGLVMSAVRSDVTQD